MKLGKKILLAGAVFCGAFGFFNMTQPALYAAGDIKVLINGVEMVADVPPLLENGRTLVPMRAIAERLGSTVDYDSISKKITIIGKDRNVTLTVNQKEAYVNGIEQLLDVPAKVVNGRTLVPLRFVGQSLGATVNWDGPSQTVTIVSATGQSSDNYPQSWADSAAWEQELLSLVNEARTDLGLNALVSIEEIAQMSRKHSRDMAVNGYFDHTSPLYGTAEQRMAAAGFAPCLENIAHGYMSATDTFNALMASPGHRDNILNPNGVFFGAGAYSLPAGEEATVADVFCTMNIITGDSFFVGARNQTVTADTMQVQGYTVNSQAEATVFLLLSGNDHVYTEKMTVPMTVQGNRFTGEIKFWQAGKYIIHIGDDNLVVTKK